MPPLTPSLTHTLQCTVGDLKDMACRAMGIEEPQQWAIWDYAGQKAGANVSSVLDDTCARHALSLFSGRCARSHPGVGDAGQMAG